MTLVVIGHGIQRLTADSDPALVLYLFIYAFHMPAFALISGYFSSADEPTRQRMTRVITDILVPYAIMETLWTLTKWIIQGEVSLNPTTPSWTLWFLLALGIFRLVLPYLALLRFPLTIAVIASVGVGYLDNVDSTFSLSRTIGILPFFVLGWKLRTWRLADWWLTAGRMRWAVRAASLTVFAVWLAVLSSQPDAWRDVSLQRWFFFNDSYLDLVGAQWWAGGVRLVVLALGTVLVAAFLTLIPRGRTSITALGQGTMYVYLLHSFVLYPLRESGALQIGYQSWSLLALMIAASITISLILASAPVRRVFRPLIEPRVDWLLVPPPDTPPLHERTLPTVSEHIDRPEHPTYPRT